MAKKKANAAEKDDPFDWVRVAIGRCKELMNGYEFLKDALSSAQGNLEQEGVAVTRGYSDAPRDITSDYRRLIEHIGRRPQNWAEFVASVERANTDNLKQIYVGRWIAITAVQAVEYQAEELRDNIAGILSWIPGPSPLWDHDYFVRNPKELRGLRDSVADIDDAVTACTPESLDKLYTLIEHEAVRLDRFMEERERQRADAETREQHLRMLAALSKGESATPKAPRAANGTPGRRPNPQKQKHAEYANKLKNSGDSWKEIAAGVNQKYNLTDEDAYTADSKRSIRSLHKHFYPSPSGPKKKPAVKR